MKGPGGPAAPEIDGGGKKDDVADNKIRLDLIPPCFTEGVGRVLTHGAEKYGADNWMRGIEFRRIIGGIKRHTLAIERGEDFDIGPGGTGMQHAYHAGCGLAFLSHYVEYYDRYAKFDDRVFYKDFAGRTDEVHVSGSDLVQDGGKVPRRRNWTHDRPDQD